MNRLKPFLLVAIALSALALAIYLLTLSYGDRQGGWRTSITISRDLPDPALTPGVAATGDKVTICNRSTKTVRNVPQSEKNEVLRRYGLKDRHDGWCGEHGCEIDHCVSLEAGGDNAIENLWPESYEGEWNAHKKDRLENKLHHMICNGEISVADAQAMSCARWVEAYKKYVAHQ